MGFIPVDDGRWVDESFERLARIVQDYDSQFELRWIPPEHRETPEERKNCYVVWDTYVNKPVFFASELDTPQDVLTRLIDGDTKHGNVLERIDKRNRAAEIIRLKEQMDEAEDRQDRVAFLMKTKKNFINMGNGRVLDDQLRVVRKGHSE